MVAEKKGTTRSGTKRPRRKKTGAAPASRGLTAAQVAAASPPAKVGLLRSAIEEDGGLWKQSFQAPVDAGVGIGGGS